MSHQFEKCLCNCVLCKFICSSPWTFRGEHHAQTHLIEFKSLLDISGVCVRTCVCAGTHTCAYACVCVCMHSCSIVTVTSVCVMTIQSTFFQLNITDVDNYGHGCFNLELLLLLLFLLLKK